MMVLGSIRGGNSGGLTFDWYTMIGMLSYVKATKESRMCEGKQRTIW